MLDLFLPDGWNDNEKSVKTYQHSFVVAKAAEKIASRTKDLDPDKSYIYGLMHDLGKFFLSNEFMYQHPRIGYEKLKVEYPDIADICISHAFPDFDVFDQILQYCHGCEVEANKIFEILKTVRMTEYVELIQFCDKVSTLDGYVTFDAKINWYIENSRSKNDELNKLYRDKLGEIKLKLDILTGYDVYDLLGVNQ